MTLDQLLFFNKHMIIYHHMLYFSHKYNLPIPYNPKNSLSNNVIKLIDAAHNSYIYGWDNFFNILELIPEDINAIIYNNNNKRLKLSPTLAPIHYAIKYNNIDVLIKIIEKRGNPHLINPFTNLTALEMAKKINNKDMINILNKVASRILDCIEIDENVFNFNSKTLVPPLIPLELVEETNKKKYEIFYTKLNYIYDLPNKIINPRHYS